VKNILTLFFREFPAQNRRCGVQTLTMDMLKKIGRLFQIKTRFEAWLVIYAIALGAVERGRHYLDTYPGVGGWLLALACTGVVFIAGGKLLDSVKAPEPALATGPYRAPVQRRQINGRNRPTRLPSRRGSESRISRHRD
jgi:hypothetical protein